MSGMIRMDTALGDQTAQRFNTAADQLQSMNQGVDAQVQALFSTWEGVSRQRFEAEYTSWKQDLARCTELLRQISQRVQKETNEMRQADQSY